MRLSEFWLLSAGVRVDDPAALTSDVAPLSGTLSNLKDNDTATDCTLAPNTTLTWDFGSSQDVDDIRLGSADTHAEFLMFTVMEWSDDGSTWATIEVVNTASGFLYFAYPGVRALTVSTDPWREWSDVKLANMTKSPGDGRIVTLTSGAGHGALGYPANSGVRQFEIVRTSTAANRGIGVWDVSFTNNTASAAVGAWIVRENEGQKSDNGTSYVSYPTGGWSATDVFGVVIDFTSGQMTCYKNGVSLLSLIHI